MDDLFGDERLQFFLRHRDDIREWAAIEREVITATRDALAGLQTGIDEGLGAIDLDVTTARRDGGGYERIMARRPTWPALVGVTLEWETGVDPFGSRLPKYGIFIDPSSELDAVYARVLALAKETPSFRAGGFKIPEGRAWPIVKRLAKSRDWWRDLHGWTAPIVRGMVELWPSAALVVDRGLAEA